MIAAVFICELNPAAQKTGCEGLTFKRAPKSSNEARFTIIDLKRGQRICQNKSYIPPHLGTLIICEDSKPLEAHPHR